MDIKEIGVTTVVVLGGAAIGVSQYGYSDVLTEEIRFASDVPMSERKAYMDTVVAQFTEFYDGAIHGTDTFNFSGPLIYETNPYRKMFTEVVQSEQEVPPKLVKELKAYHADNYKCEEEDTRLFTDKGWTYRISLKNIDGKPMVSVTCKPSNLGLRSSIS